LGQADGWMESFQHLSHILAIVFMYGWVFTLKGLMEKVFGELGVLIDIMRRVRLKELWVLKTVTVLPPVNILWINTSP
jgi:hypothetical protein